MDDEYERSGTANLSMRFAPLEGWRNVKATDRRTARDYAHLLRELSGARFPQAEKIILVQDNLNTPCQASFCRAFPPEEARRLVERFEWRFTPKHGSWRLMAQYGRSRTQRPSDPNLKFVTLIRQGRPEACLKMQVPRKMQVPIMNFRFR